MAKDEADTLFNMAEKVPVENDRNISFSLLMTE